MMNRSAVSGNGSLPSRFLTTISQTEALLRRTSLAGSENNAFASLDSSLLPATSQRKVQVSSRSRISGDPRSAPRALPAMAQKSWGAPRSLLQDRLASAYGAPPE